jgi:hypothetical protein
MFPLPLPQRPAAVRSFTTTRFFDPLQVISEFCATAQGKAGRQASPVDEDKTYDTFDVT